MNFSIGIANCKFLYHSQTRYVWIYNKTPSRTNVYVKEAAVNTVYITSSNTIFTINKGKSQTLNATLTGNGIANSDQYNLKWTTSDSDIVQVTGISSDGTVSGQSIYITAIKPSEALITCSHEKAASDLQFYVVVPGSAEKLVTLNKTYLTLTKGSSGTSLKANIENAESSSDYQEGSAIPFKESDVHSKSA